jgi:DNA-binding HxlR family transcriptional regulator
MDENAQAVDGDSGEPSVDTECCCPLGGIMDLLSRKYAIQVVCVIDQLQPARYGEIEDAFAEVSSSTLSTRLDELTEAGLLKRSQYNEIPPRVEYDLTERGEELGELLAPVLQWVENQDTVPS